MTRDEFKQALVQGAGGLGLKVYHMQAVPADGSRFICWQELYNRNLYGDDKAVIRIPRVQVDFFTTREYDTANLLIPAMLRKTGCNVYHDGQTFDPERSEWRNVWTVSFVEKVN